MILVSIGHWNSLHYKVSQGGARGARMNFFQVDWQKLDKCISIIISISVVSFINFEASFVTLFRVKVIKKAPNHKILTDFEPFPIQLFFVNLFHRPISDYNSW